MREKVGINPKSVRSNYALNLLYEVFALLTPLITTPYVSRVLGAEGVGIYSFTNSIAQIFILIGNLGVATYGQMAIAEHQDDQEEVSRIFYELWIFRAITMIISFGIYMMVSFMSTSYQEERLILGILVFASIFDLTWLFRGIEDFSKVVIRNIIVKIVMIALIFLLVKTPDDVGIYVLLVALSTLLGNLTFLFSMRGILCRVKLKSLRVFRHAKQCLIFFIPTIATSVYTVLDKTMLGILTNGAIENGYYEQAHRIEQVLIVVITSLNTIMRSRMSFLYQHGQLDEMKQRLNRSISFILCISIPMTSGLIAVSPIFIPLFLGDGFEKSIVLMQIFSFLIIIIGLSNCLNTHFLGPSGRQGKNNYVLILGAIINFVCNYFTIPIYGAVGAACSSVLAETIILIGYLILSRDFFKASTLFKLGWRYLIAGIIMACIVSCIGYVLENNFITLVIQVVSGIVCYFLIVLIIKDPFVWSTIKMVVSSIKEKIKT